MMKRDQETRAALRKVVDALPFARDQREVAYKTAEGATDETARAMLDAYQRLVVLLPGAHAALDTLDVELGRVPATSREIETKSVEVVSPYCLDDPMGKQILENIHIVRRFAEARDEIPSFGVVRAYDFISPGVFLERSFEDEARQRQAKAVDEGKPVRRFHSDVPLPALASLIADG